MTNAYVNAAGRSPDTTFVGADNQLGGQVLVPGVYRVPAAATYGSDEPSLARSGRSWSIGS